MSKHDELARFTGLLKFEEADLDEVSIATRQLLRELDELNLGDAELRTTESPQGSKSGSMTVLGAFGVSVAANLVPVLIDFFRRWCERRKQQNETVIIELSADDRMVKLEIDAGMPDNVLKEYLTILSPSKKHG